MLNIVGAVLVIGASAGFGIGTAMGYYRKVRQLREFCRSLEILKCEMNYTLAPVGQLCRVTAQRVGGTAGAYFSAYGEGVEAGLSRGGAAQRAIEKTKALTLPNDALMCLLELCGDLGRYELPGENRLIDLTLQRLRGALERYEGEKRPMVRGYVLLSICTGIALTILMI